MEDNFRLLQERVANEIRLTLASRPKQGLSIEELAQEIVGRNPRIYQEACLWGNGYFKRDEDGTLHTKPDIEEVKSWIKSVFKTLCQVGEWLRYCYMTNWAKRNEKYYFSPIDEVLARHSAFHAHPELSYGRGGN